jgi:hypothetical protein
MAIGIGQNYVHESPTFIPREASEFPPWYQEGDSLPTWNRKRVVISWLDAEEIETVVTAEFPGGLGEYNLETRTLNPVIEEVPGLFNGVLIGKRWNI